MNAISQEAGARVGPDYLNGEKTPVAVLALFHSPCESNNPCNPAFDPLVTPAGAYHDFWQSIVSGAQGILIYSYFHRNDSTGDPYEPDLLNGWERYNDAARELTGPESLDDVVLLGETIEAVGVNINGLPSQTVSFTPYLGTMVVSYEAIDLLAKVWNGNT